MNKINTTISEALYGTQKRQSELEFFDNCLYGDVVAFFDYTLVKHHAQKGNKLALSIISCVNVYMTNIYNTLSNHDDLRLRELLSCLNEVKHTKIGYAQTRNGNGVGMVLSEAMREKLLFMKEAMNKGNYSYLSIPIAIEGISSDRSSDILTAISLSTLVKFTEELAIKNGWKTREVYIKNIFDPSTGSFINYKANLPIAETKTPILYPKMFINNVANMDGIFESFKWKLFNDYIRYDLRFVSYWTEKRNYITQKEFREILKLEGRTFKEYLREFIVNNYGIVDLLENSLQDIRMLTDEELESLQHCRIRKSA